MPTINKKVRQLRRGYKLSMNALAEKSGLSPAYISKLEKGEFKSLSLKTCKALAEGFEMSLRDFLEEINFIDINKERPSSQIISHAYRSEGYSFDEIVKIKEYAELLRRANCQ